MEWAEIPGMSPICRIFRLRTLNPKQVGGVFRGTFCVPKEEIPTFWFGNLFSMRGGWLTQEKIIRRHMRTLWKKSQSLLSIWMSSCWFIVRQIMSSTLAHYRIQTQWHQKDPSKDYVCILGQTRRVSMPQQAGPGWHHPIPSHLLSKGLNRICALVVDLRPATGAVATLARILGGVAGSSPACATRAACAVRARWVAGSKPFECFGTALLYSFFS